jgi:uroporphyrin-III C-methyltransferase
MAVTNLASIVGDLLDGGLSRQTPALIVHAATTDAEAVAEAALGDLPRLAAERAIQSPAIVVVGAIAGFRSEVLGHLLPFRAEAAA